MNKGRQAVIKSLAGSPVAARVIASAADVALVIDKSGKVLDLCLGDGFEVHPGWSRLIGKLWIETVGTDSRGKVESLLLEAREGRTTRAREINQNVEGLGEVPVRFSGALLDDNHRVVALGRDLRPLANLQQRMISAQQGDGPGLRKPAPG